MGSFSPWRGVRLGFFEVGEDPDAPTRRVAIPAGWDEPAARGFVGLIGPARAVGRDAVRLPTEAERWIAPLDRLARAAGMSDELGQTLHCLLLMRQGCPDQWAWRGAGAPAGSGDRGFVLHLAAFADPDTGLDAPSLRSAATAACLALSLARRDAGFAGRAVLRVAGLDGLLASLGLAYDSDAGRDIAVDVMRQLRAAIDGVDRDVRLRATAASHADALLGVETAGVAAPFSPVTIDGKLTAASASRLVALGLSPERALAMTLDGAPPLPVLRDGVAEAAMADSLAAVLDDRDAAASPRARPRLVVAPAPDPTGSPAGTIAGGARPVPSRAKGFTQKVSIGGHRLFLRTAEYDDGTLAEIALTMPGRDGNSSRALMEAVSAAVSVGLQHGVPLGAFVALFAHGRFGPRGAVEGDPEIAVASSPLDYAMRALSGAYGGPHVADPLVPDLAPSATDPDPRLPLQLPGGDGGDGGDGDRVASAAGPAQRTLRLVRAS